MTGAVVCNLDAMVVETRRGGQLQVPHIGSPLHFTRTMRLPDDCVQLFTRIGIVARQYVEELVQQETFLAFLATAHSTLGRMMAGRCVGCAAFF